jgi:D-beta-D-heptose 7-phosphate kinase/D-beta-D-heptose 1-phosphate adenosyltransferase
MNVHSRYALDSNVVNAIPRHGFSQARVLVIGDLMLDRYVLGDVARISPEAPVPILTVREERTVAGGAANVAVNAANLRAKVFAAGVIGRDAPGERLRSLLLEQGIADTGIVQDISRPTTCKTRVMCNNHQIVRMDSEVCEDLAPEVCVQLYACIQGILTQGVDTVLVSDYAKGVLTIEITQRIIAACIAKNIPVLVDPKRYDYTPYSGATCITPNHKEFRAALEAMSMPVGDIGACGALLRNRLGCTALLVTQGALGMTAITREHAHHFPALAEEVFDVSGAGDTVIATVGTCLGGGLDFILAAQIANVAASLVVRRAGTVPVEWEELYSTITRCPEDASQASASSAARMVG